MYALGIWDAETSRARPGARPLRHQTALLLGDRWGGPLRLAGTGTRGRKRALARSRSGGGRGLSLLGRGAGAAHPAQVDPRPAGRCHSRRATATRCQVVLENLGRRSRGKDERGPSWRRRRPGAPGERPRPSGLRRADRALPLGGPRFGPDRGARCPRRSRRQWCLRARAAHGADLGRSARHPRRRGARSPATPPRSLGLPHTSCARSTPARSGSSCRGSSRRWISRRSTASTPGWWRDWRRRRVSRSPSPASAATSSSAATARSATSRAGIAGGRASRRLPGLAAVWPAAARQPRAPSARSSPASCATPASFAGAYVLRRALFLPHEVDAAPRAAPASPTPASGRRPYYAPLDAWERLGEATLGEPSHLLDDPWRAVHRLESSIYLRHQLLRDSDWAGMAHGVEIRTPLVDACLRTELERAQLRTARSRGKAALVRSIRPRAPRRALRAPEVGLSAADRGLAGAGRRRRSTPRGQQSRRLALMVLEAFGVSLPGAA